MSNTKEEIKKDVKSVGKHTENAVHKVLIKPRKSLRK